MQSCLQSSCLSTFRARGSGTFIDSHLLHYCCFGCDQKWACRLQCANDDSTVVMNFNLWHVTLAFSQHDIMQLAIFTALVTQHLFSS